MIELVLIGIGTGNPEHLTHEATEAIRSADLILLPLKGGERSNLAALRKRIITAEIGSQPHDHTRRSPAVLEFLLPDRDPSIADYHERVDHWHERIAEIWEQSIQGHFGESLTGTVALLIWGDPSLYDSSLRIVDRIKQRQVLSCRVIPGITAIQALCAAHAITLNTIGEPVLITTGRKLMAEGWPDGVNTVVVMLDANCAFTTIDKTRIHIWWGAYVAMEEQLLISGPLNKVANDIVECRKQARDTHGWIMDIYLLRRSESGS